MADLKRVDYTTKDYAGYREDMVERIPQVMPEWTDRSTNDPGIVLLELLAFELEKLSYYNDRVANETFLTTATQRKSVINHCKLIGYELDWHTAAKQWQVFEIVPQPEDTVIPAGAMVGTPATPGEDSVIFELLTDLIIPAGQTGTEQDVDGNYLYKVEVEQGQTIENEDLGVKDASSVEQAFPLGYSPVLKDTIRVWVEGPNGRREWTRVDDFVASKQGDTHFMAEMDEYDRVKIRFGNGASGDTPAIGDTVTASCKVGGGTVGNVGSNTITEYYVAVPGLERTFNPLGPHVLGADKESIEDAKWKGPASLRQLGRYVTLPDYETGLLMDVEGLGKIKAVNNGGLVELYIVSETGTNIPADVKTEILEVIDRKKVMFTQVALRDPGYITMDVSVDLISYGNYDPTVIKYTAENVLRELFEPRGLDFGQPVTLANIHYALLSNVEGVRNPVVLAPAADPVVGATDMIRLGTLTVTVDGK